MLVVRSVAGPMVVRRRDTVVLSAPVVTPSTSASHSVRNCRGACTARIPSSRRWLALGTSTTDPSGVTPCTAPSTCTGADVEPRLLTSTVSHLIRSWCSPAGPTGYPIAGHLEGPSDEHRELGRVDVRRQWMARFASIRHTT